MLSILQALQQAGESPKHSIDTEEALHNILVDESATLHKAFECLLKKDLSHISEEKKLMRQFLLKVTESPESCTLPELKIIVEFIGKQTHPAHFTDLLTQFIRDMALYPSFKYKLNMIIAVIEGYQHDRYNDAHELISELIEIDDMNAKAATFTPSKPPYIDGIIRSPMLTEYRPHMMSTGSAAGSASSASANRAAVLTDEEAQKCEVRLYAIIKNIFELSSNHDYFTLADLLAILAVCVTHAEDVQYSPVIKTLICDYIGDFYEARELTQDEHDPLIAFTHSNQFSDGHEHLKKIIENAAALYRAEMNKPTSTAGSSECHLLGMDVLGDEEDLRYFTLS